MTTFTRRQLVTAGAALGMTSTFLPRSFAAGLSSNPLAQVDSSWLVTRAEALRWHQSKDSLGGPTFAGSPSWQHFMGLLEDQLRSYGCVDIGRSPWHYDRLDISLWPDDSQWRLTVEGRPVSLANFGANCGVTSANGVTAPLVLWDDDTKPDIAGKIVVYRPRPRANIQTAFGRADYEYLTPFESYPVSGKPVAQSLGATGSIAPVVVDQMTATALFVKTALEGKAAGLLFALDLPMALAKGLYTFLVPERYDIPSAYLDRVNGDAVIADARAGKSATLKILGRYVDAEPYQLVAYLPGKDYGTSRDQQIQLRTHTDGPSLVQDNGAFGLVALVKYMSHLPQAERPRTLFVELDCRHYMPGLERRWAAQDYFVKNPRARDKVVGMIAMEHLGNVEFAFGGDGIQPTGRTHLTSIYATENQRMIDEAYKAAKDNQLPAAAIRSPGRPGSQGKSQGPWFGMGSDGRVLGLPTFAAMADPGANWQTAGRMDRFDVDLFLRQVATFAQLTGFLMGSDLTTLQAPKGPLPAAGLN